MDRFYKIVNVIFIHALYLLTEVGSFAALYIATTEDDVNFLGIAILCRLARQCLIPMWKEVEEEVWNCDNQ